MLPAAIYQARPTTPISSKRVTDKSATKLVIMKQETHVVMTDEELEKAKKIDAAIEEKERRGGGYVDASAGRYWSPEELGPTQ